MVLHFKKIGCILKKRYLKRRIYYISVSWGSRCNSGTDNSLLWIVAVSSFSHCSMFWMGRQGDYSLHQKFLVQKHKSGYSWHRLLNRSVSLFGRLGVTKIRAWWNFCFLKIAFGKFKISSRFFCSENMNRIWWR